MIFGSHTSPHRTVRKTFFNTANNIVAICHGRHSKMFNISEVEDDADDDDDDDVDVRLAAASPPPSIAYEIVFSLSLRAHMRAAYMYISLYT